MSADLLFFCCINVLLAWSVYAVMTTGVLSFAAAAFMAVGCYTSGLLSVKAGWPMWASLPAGALVAALASLPIGIPTLRLRGVHFILATIGVTISMQVVLENIEFVGGSTGFGGMMGATPTHAVVAVIVIGLILTFIAFSPLQRILDAVREDSRVADSLGVNSVYVRVAAFAAVTGLPRPSSFIRFDGLSETPRRRWRIAAESPAAAGDRRWDRAAVVRRESPPPAASP